LRIRGDDDALLKLGEGEPSTLCALLGIGFISGVDNSLPLGEEVYDEEVLGRCCKGTEPAMIADGDELVAESARLRTCLPVRDSRGIAESIAGVDGLRTSPTALLLFFLFAAFVASPIVVLELPGPTLIVDIDALLDSLSNL
jgi:hypothetical protein